MQDEEALTNEIGSIMLDSNCFANLDARAGKLSMTHSLPIWLTDSVATTARTSSVVSRKPNSRPAWR